MVELATHTKELQYSVLCDKLQIPSVAQLEDLLLHAMYADLINGGRACGRVRARGTPSPACRAQG